MIEFSYSPPLGWVLGGAILVLALFWLAYHRAKGKPGPRLKLGLIALRFLAVSAIVICLLDPQHVETIKHQQKARVALLLDASRSMGINDLPGGRINAAKGWIEKHISGSVPSGVTLSSYTFDESLAPLPKLDSASPTGAVTALSQALENLLNVPSSDPLTGVILVSDGIESSSDNPESAARLYRRKGIPIHTVLAGTTNETKDIVLETVQVKKAVPNEAPTRVALTLRSPGFRNQKVNVIIRREKEMVAAEEVVLTGDTQKLEIEVTPKQKGFHTYEASIAAQPGEWLAANNRRLFGMEVIDPTIRVIYMEGTPQHAGSPIPEWKYLKDALESDPNIKVKTLYRQLGDNGQFLNTIDVDSGTGERIYPVEHPTQGFPKTLSDLLQYDVVIHSDIKKESFSAVQLQNIAKLVELHGGGFVMIGGNSAFGKGGYHKTILDKIIPVAMQLSNDSDARSIRMKVAPGAYLHPIMDIGSTRAETERIWTTKFPTLYGANRVDYAKPGAVILGVDPNQRNQFGSSLLLAVQEIGKGRSMAFTSDTTRSWGRDFETLWGEPIRPGLQTSESNCDSRYYRQFWVNAVRWLASNKVGKTNNAVSLELAQNSISVGETVQARIRVRDSDLRETANAEISIWMAANGRTNQVSAARYDTAARCFIADLQTPDAGNYMISAVARRRGAVLGEDQQLLVSEKVDLEMRDVRARPDVLDSIARTSLGKTFSVADKEGSSLAYAFTNIPAPTIEYRRTPIWDKLVWLVLILGLLGTEWAIRRKQGLA